MLDNYPKLSINNKTIRWVKVVVLLGEGSIHHRKTNCILCCLGLNDKCKEIIDIKVPFIDVRFFHYTIAMMYGTTNSSTTCKTRIRMKLSVLMGNCIKIFILRALPKKKNMGWGGEYFRTIK